MIHQIFKDVFTIETSWHSDN